MRRRRSIVLLISVCLLFGASIATSPSALAQITSQNVDDPWALARDAYRNQDWTNARRFTALASQRDPEEPRYYLSLGRIAFQQGLFEDAVWFYDIFDEYARLSGQSYSGSYAVDRAKAERESANTRRDHPAQVAREPDAQVRVREALLARLKEGSVLGEGGTGALATFQSLLQMGYANPDLKQLRAAIDEAANAEAARLLKREDGRIPVLSYEQWQQQSRRYDASSRLILEPIPFDGGTPSPGIISPNTAYRSLAEGQMQYLLQNAGNAEKRFREALEQQPTLSLAHQGLLNALLAAPTPNGEALRSALQAFESVDPKNPNLSIYQALVEASSGQARRAASILHQILTHADSRN